jgi:hypothetical protein
MGLKNKNEDLRNLLFETLGAILDGTITAENANAIASVAKEINSSAKNELLAAKLAKANKNLDISQRSQIPSFFEEKSNQRMLQ